MSIERLSQYFIVGIAASSALGISVALGVVWAIVISGILLLSCIYFLNKSPKVVSMLGICVVLFLGFWVRTTYQIQHNKSQVISWVHHAYSYDDFIKLNDRPQIKVSMDFVVLDTVFATNQTAVLVRSVTDDRLVSLQLNSTIPRLRYGDVVTVSGYWGYPHLPRNPGVSDTTKSYLYNGISGKIYPSTLVVTGHRVLNPIKQFALFLKEKVLFQHKRSLPYPYSDLLTSFIFGDSGTSLPDTISDQFQRTGMTHVLVVSGAQVTLLCGIVFQILRLFGLRGMASTGIMGGVCVVFYFLSGAGTSVLRAVIMTMFALSFQLYYYRASIFHIIAATFLVMVAFNPLVVADIGAQLSFMATISLVLGSRFIEDFLPLTWPNWFRSGVAVSISPFLFTTPIVLYHFHRVSLVSIFVNFVSIQVVEWIVVIGFFSTAAGFFSFYMANVANHGLFFLMWILNALTSFIAKWQFSVIYLPTGIGFVMGWYLVLVLILFGIRFHSQGEKKLAGAMWRILGWSSFIFIVSVSVWGFANPPKLRVIQIDVGQGDSALILTPSGHSILIDAGPKQFKKGYVDDAGERAVLPVLNYYGVNVLDLVIVTHFHLDHYGGLSSVLAHVPAKHIWDNSRLEKAPKSYMAFIAAHPELRQAANPGVLQFDDGVILRCFYPFKDVSHTTENNASVVVKVSYGDSDFMFTGDLEKEGERDLVTEYPNQLKCEVLKLGHHGSKTSSSELFLDAVHPMCGVASVGLNNRYKHPSKEIVSRLRDYGITLYRTDEQGAIFFETDGHQIHTKTFLD